MDDLQALSADDVETEVKLGATVDFVLPDVAQSLPDLHLSEAPTLVLEAVYHDTDDLALVRNKVSLRHRTGEGAARWTLKLPKPEAEPEPAAPDAEPATVERVLRRRELEVFTDDGSVVPDVLRSLVTAWTRGADVKPVITLRTTRSRTELRRHDTGDAVGEIDDDLVEVIQDDQVVDVFREIEVEVRAHATTDVLPTVTAALRYAGAGEPDTTSKVGRALGTRAAVPPAPLRVVVDKHSTIAELVRSSVTDATIALVRADHAVRLDRDPVGVRCSAGASRRLRAELRALRPFLDDAAVSHTRAELAWLIAQLGRVRELDVIERRLRVGLSRLDDRDQSAGLPIIEHLAAVREMTRSGLVTSMSSPRYVQLLASLVASSAQPPLVDNVAGDPARRHAAKLVRRSLRKVEREVSRLGPTPTDLDLDHLRRRVKQARYTAQLAEPVLSSSSRHLTRALAELQGVLGALGDAKVTDDWLRSTATLFADHSISLVAGELIALQRVDAAAARREWSDAWATVDRPELTGFLP